LERRVSGVYFVWNGGFTWSILLETEGFRRVFHAEHQENTPEIPRKLYENAPKLYDISTESPRKLYESIPNENAAKTYENTPKTLRNHCENTPG
jgi:hypothetical protein